MTNGNDIVTPVEVFWGDGSSQIENKGLTKREHFAAIALQGLLSNPTICTPNADFDVIKETAVLMADGLISQLNSK